MRTETGHATPRRSTFQMRIDPETKRRAETVYANYGLTLTDAVNIFIQQSLNENGLPFLLSPENMEYKKAKAWKHLMSEIEKGWQSAEKDGWVSLEEIEAELGVADE